MRWPFRKKDGSQGDAAGYGSAAPIDDEWAFLRQQPDHDAAEMASVRVGGAVGGAAEPAATWQPARKAGRASRRAAAEAPGASLALEITSGGATRRLAVTGEALVGRADAGRGIQPEVDLTGDDGVSRRHALISCEGGRFSIRDLDSIGGTRLNGTWLGADEERALAPGDCLELGHDTKIVVLADIAAAGEPELTEEDLVLGGMVRDALGLADDPPAAAPEPAASGGTEESAAQHWWTGAPATRRSTPVQPGQSAVREEAAAGWQPRPR